MVKYAGIIVDISLEKLDRIFEYRIPEEMQDKINIGTKVWIPFGKGNRKISGFVLSIRDFSEYDAEKLKSISGVCEEGIPVEGQLIALAEWMRDRYGCTMNQALKTVIPVKTRVQEKTRQWVFPACDRQQTEAFIEKNRRSKAKCRVLEILLKKGQLEQEELLREAATARTTLIQLQSLGMVRLESEIIYRNPGIMEAAHKEIFFNEEQRSVIEAFHKDRREGRRKNYLIHGVTGSGKTEVYMEMIAAVIREGRQAIVLIPEIALTFQTVQRFFGKFGNRVSVIHSRLSQGERFDQFERAKKGEIDVMIGPRSAVFTPFPNLGIIVIDEEHEGSYKSETTPKYHAKQVAKKRCELSDAVLVLGSATPSVESYYEAMHGGYQLFTMEKRIEERPMAQVEIIDLREELKLGNRSVISRRLHERMEEVLNSGQQMMLFLNRRGYAGFISCRSCGHVMKCPHCDVSLTLHKNKMLRCHYCGYEQPEVKLCPACGSRYIGGFRAGTQQIETVVKKEFPGIRVLRMDMDTTRNKGDYERILKQFRSGEADVLIGTQMIVKGHDFPGVTLVGALLADLSLHASDYCAAERTFELLTQAAGRAGRGIKPGYAVIQTYQPEHYSIQSAAAQDYRKFYETEIAYRELLSYPPVSGMMAVLLMAEDEDFLEKEAEKIKTMILEMELPLLCVTGPAKASVSKISDVYRNVIYLKCEDRRMLCQVRDYIEEKKETAVIPETVRIEFDENPLHAY